MTSSVHTTPKFGRTRAGLPVHAKTKDHHRDDTAYQRFNKKVALWLTNNVGTMTCYWIFNVVAIVSLPAVLAGVSNTFFGFFPSWTTKAALVALIAWVSSNYLQLTLLPAIMVGQHLQSAASDARAAKTFEDVTTVLDRLNVKTQGGLRDVVDHFDSRLDELESRLPGPTKSL
jgi:hypothetical protein